MYKKITVYARLEELRSYRLTRGGDHAFRVLFCNTDHFRCPSCNTLIALRVSYKPNAGFRSSVCAECGSRYCLQFLEDSCGLCRHRTVDCLLKVQVKLELVHSHSRHEGLYLISRGLWPLSRIQEEIERMRQRI